MRNWLPRQTEKMTAMSIQLVAIGLVLSAVAGVHFGIVWPMQQASSKCQNEVDRLRALSRRGPAIRKQLDQARARHAELTSKQVEFRARLPQEAREEDFLAQIARLARKVDLEIRDYRPVRVEHQSDYSEVEIELRCLGSYESICQFLDQISEIPRLTSLIRLKVQTANEKSEYPIQLNFSAYFVPMKEEGAGRPTETAAIVR